MASAGLLNWLKRYATRGEKQRKAWHRYLAQAAEKRGLHVYKSHLNWMLPGPFMQAAERWGDIPGIPLDRCQTLFAAGRAVAGQGIAGATADCGVRFGRSSHFMLSGLDEADRLHHVFDSFEGLSAPTQSDAVSNTQVAGNWQAGDLAVTQAQVEANLAAFPNCRFHRGWIPEGFAQCESESFSLVHIDVDLFEPTRDAFAFFYPRMVKGGMMLCDDYGFASCPGATRALDEFFADKPEKPLSLSSGQALIVRLD